MTAVPAHPAQPGVRRVVGIETEYGVTGGPNPMLMSSQVVAAYRATLGQTARWDYAHEDPLCDARGHRLPRASAHPSLLTDDPERLAPSGDAPTTLARPASNPYDDPGALNAILPNGGRLYVDHAHPEYSSPEVATPYDVVRYDVAGERVMARASAELARAGIDVVLYKNNQDGKGASYGTHENYLVDRAVPFATLVEVLTPFLVTRQVFTGSGRVGLGQTGLEPGFQLSQRADFIEAEVGLETTMRRPIINTRDEPHADAARWRRLHVILGDANLLEPATLLKAGTTSLVLGVLEHAAPHHLARLTALALADPVECVATVSRDLDLAVPLPLRDGRRLTALEVQCEYLAVCQEAVGAGADAATTDVLERWEDVLARLGTSTAQCARDVEWVAKLRLLEGMRRRGGLSWDDPRLAAFDLQWADVRPDRGLYQRLLASGAVERVVTEADVAAAVVQPPADTRAYFRGTVVRTFGPHVVAAGWDSVVLDVPGAPHLHRVPMPDPWRGTADLTSELFTAHADDVATFVAALTR